MEKFILSESAPLNSMQKIEKVKVYTYMTVSKYLIDIKYLDIEMLDDRIYSLDQKIQKNNCDEIVGYIPDFSGRLGTNIPFLLEAQYYAIIQNMLSSRAYIQEVKRLFAERPKIDILYPQDIFSVRHKKIQHIFFQKGGNLPHAFWIRKKSVLKKEKIEAEILNEDYAGIYVENMEYLIELYFSTIL